MMTADIEMLPLPPVINAQSVQDYARAVAEHNIAARDAEIERLKVVAHGFVDEIAAKDAEIEALRAEVVRWKSSYNEAIELKGRAFAESDRLAEALQWYAEQAELCRKLGATGDSGRRALDADGGKRARVALDQEVGNGSV